MPTLFHGHANWVTTTLTMARSAHDPYLTVADPSRFALANPTATNPIRVSVRRGNVPLCILDVIHINSNVMTVVGAIEGTTDVDMIVGDNVWLAITAQDVQDIEDAINAMESSGGSYTNPTPMPQALGGLSAGHTFSAESVTQVFDELFYPYQVPAFTSFAIQSQPTPLEVGTPITGSHTFVWSTSNPTNVAPNSVGISGVATGLPPSGTQISTLNLANDTNTTETWTIQATNTQGQLFGAIYVVTWLWKNYWGNAASTTLDNAAILGLDSNALATTYAGTYAMPATGYKYLVYPDIFGGLTSIKDTSTGFGVAMATSSDDPFYETLQNGYFYGKLSVTNVLSVATTYRVYRTKNILNGALTIGVL